MVLFLQINTTTYASRENIEYGQKLTSASQAAIDTIDYEKIAEGQDIWSDVNTRKKALDVFYRTLALSLNEPLTDKRLQVSTPITLFIDNDGYYIGYNIINDLSNIADVSKENQFANSMQTTELIPWSTNINGYTVRFTLTNEITVITPLGEIFSGSTAPDTVTGSVFRKLYLSANYPGDEISDLYDKVTEYYDQNVVTDMQIKQIQQTIQKYINEYNTSAVVNNAGYSLEMPVVGGEMWHRLMENPTFVSFLQGTNVNTGKNIVSVYGYAGSEAKKGEKWFITTDGSGEYIYHRLSVCLDTNEATLHSEPDGKKYVTLDPSHFGSSASEIHVLYNSAEECALKGAKPCPDCVYGIRP